MHSKAKRNADYKHIITGVGTGLLFMLITSSIAAFVLTKSDMEYHVVRYLVCCLTAVSAFLAGYISKKKNKMKGIICGLISGGIVLVVVFILLFLISGMQVRGESVLLFPSALLSGMLGGVIASNVR